MSFRSTAGRDRSTGDPLRRVAGASRYETLVADVLACASSIGTRPSRFGRCLTRDLPWSWGMDPSSALTAAGPRRIHTDFPASEGAPSLLLRRLDAQGWVRILGAGLGSNAVGDRPLQMEEGSRMRVSARRGTPECTSGRPAPWPVPRSVNRSRRLSWRAVLQSHRPSITPSLSSISCRLPCAAADGPPSRSSRRPSPPRAP